MLATVAAAAGVRIKPPRWLCAASIPSRAGRTNRVREAAARLGYVARGARRQVIGVIVPYIGHRVYSELFAHLRREAAGYDFTTLLSITMRWSEDLFTRRVGGRGLLRGVQTGVDLAVGSVDGIEVTRWCIHLRLIDEAGERTAHRGRSARISMLHACGLELEDLAAYAIHKNTRTIKKYARRNPIHPALSSRTRGHALDGDRGTVRP
ncbi:MAG: LacI family DNA-binding transcriptional regulator [Chloroflexi bacterium]|nr:LacI family DNA-binding transcriptional regulator [Chloroflexota bacterium]